MKNTALRILNPIIGLLVLSQVSTGLLNDHLPDWLFPTVHEAGGVLLLIGVVTHVTLNFAWVKSSYFKRPTAKA